MFVLDSRKNSLFVKRILGRDRFGILSKSSGKYLLFFPLVMDYTKIVVIVHSRRSDALLSLNGTLVTKLKGLIGFKNSLITTKSRICSKTHF